MKYINFILQEIPTLTCMLPVELWMNVLDFNKMIFNERVKKLALMLEPQACSWGVTFRPGVAQLITYEASVDRYSMGEELFFCFMHTNEHHLILSWEMVIENGKISRMDFTCESPRTGYYYNEHYYEYEV